VNNTNLDILSSTVFRLSHSSGKIIAFDWGCPYLTHLFFVISENITINYILPKTRFFGLHFYGGQCGSSFNCLTHLTLKSNAFSVITEITQNNGNYVVHGHSRESPIFGQDSYIWPTSEHVAAFGWVLFSDLRVGCSKKRKNPSTI